MGKVTFLIFSLISLTSAAQKTVDSFVIFDTYYKGNMYGICGASSMTVTVNDSVQYELDAKSYKGKGIKDDRFGTGKTLTLKVKLQGLKIYFRQGDSVKLRIQSKDKYRGFDYFLDTTITYKRGQYRSSYFWVTLRQNRARELAFLPEKLDLSNEEFEDYFYGFGLRSSLPVYRAKRIRKFNKYIKYVYTSVTGERQEVMNSP